MVSGAPIVHRGRFAKAASFQFQNMRTVKRSGAAGVRN